MEFVVYILKAVVSTKSTSDLTIQRFYAHNYRSNKDTLNTTALEVIHVEFFSRQKGSNSTRKFLKVESEENGFTKLIGSGFIHAGSFRQRRTGKLPHKNSLKKGVF